MSILGLIQLNHHLIVLYLAKPLCFTWNISIYTKFIICLGILFPISVNVTVTVWMSDKPVINAILVANISVSRETLVNNLYLPCFMSYISSLAGYILSSPLIPLFLLFSSIILTFRYINGIILVLKVQLYPGLACTRYICGYRWFKL